MLVPAGATQITAVIGIDNDLDGYYSDKQIYAVVTMAGVPVQVGPFTYYSATYKTYTWPVASSQWGKTVEMTAAVTSPLTNSTCSGGVVIDKIRSACN